MKSVFHIEINNTKYVGKNNLIQHLLIIIIGLFIYEFEIKISVDEQSIVEKQQLRLADRFVFSLNHTLIRFLCNLIAVAYLEDHENSVAIFSKLLCLGINIIKKKIQHDIHRFTDSRTVNVGACPSENCFAFIESSVQLYCKNGSVSLTTQFSLPPSAKGKLNSLSK